MHELYPRADPAYTGRATVPVLRDRSRHTIVKNESADILQILNSDFGAMAHNDIDLRPLSADPNMMAYLRRLLALPAFAGSTRADHIKAGYYSIRALNPTGIVPAGPLLDDLCAGSLSALPRARRDDALPFGPGRRRVRQAARAGSSSRPGRNRRHRAPAASARGPACSGRLAQHRRSRLKLRAAAARHLPGRGHERPPGCRSRPGEAALKTFTYISSFSALRAMCHVSE
ncbi:hypothetical protein [Thauera aminoaromatica]|uniref:hypothetical protein n=1 Tax=Thauera aminoaromatica TaxID=164330 RepID=UPI0023F12CF7|nr:hypothetical protein [Thauera aminoaromatica]